MSYGSRLIRPSILVKAAARGGVIASAALLAAAGTGTLVVAPASAASTALPVSLVGGNGATAHYGQGNDIVLTTPVNGNPTTDANISVDTTSLGDTSVPQTPPSFTVDNYAGGNPRWDIMLSDNVPIYGYPAQIGGTANASFTGAQWTAGYSGTTYMTYQQALAQADPGGTAHVTGAIIEDAGGQAATSMTVTNVQYDGESPEPGTVTVAPVAAQTLGAGVAAPPVQVHASTTIAPTFLTYRDNGTLPAGLTIDPGTGVISGTPDATGTSTATITVGDAANETASVQISYTVNPTAAWACQLSTGCSWRGLDDPGTMVMDVSGQIPSTGAAIIAYAPAPSDPAADFTTVPSGFGSSKQLRYTPYGTLQNAKYLDATLAADAYNANGSAKYCVSSVADISGQALQLRPCATVANKWQDFVSGPSQVGGTMIEPTYGTPGVSAGSNPMAINDRAYGGDGTPLINYAATGSTNELFKPGV